MDNLYVIKQLMVLYFIGKRTGKVTVRRLGRIWYYDQGNYRYIKELNPGLKLQLMEDLSHFLKNHGYVDENSYSNTILQCGCI